jgi:FtsH-binding integral membrane protein
MPKTSKNSAKTKTQLKAKRNAQPEAPGITTKKSYWVMLSIVMVAVFSVAGYVMDLGVVNIAVLMVTIVFLVGLIGYVRITPSNLSNSKRGTLLFVGASVIGFSIWAIPMYILITTELIESVFNNPFFIVPSLIICLTLGAFIGELMGRNSRIQKFFFKSKDDL